MRKLFKNIMTTALTCTFVHLHIYTSAQTTVFQKTFMKSIMNKGDGFISTTAVIKTKDNGYVAIGTIAEGYISRQEQIYILKMDSTFNALWLKVIGSDWTYNGLTGVYGFTQTSDSGFVITGRTHHSKSGSTTAEMFIIKTDANGNIIWSTVVGNATLSDNNYVSGTVLQINDGGYIIAANYFSRTTSPYDWDIYIIKIDNQGTVKWTKCVGRRTGLSNEYVKSILPTSDGGYILSGTTGTQTNKLGYDAFLMKTDSLGSVLWTKTYESGNGNEMIGVNFYASYQGLYPSFTNDNPENTLASLQKTKDGGYVIAGTTTSFGAGGYDVYLIKTDNSGVLEWSRTYGGSGTDMAYSVQQTADNGFIIAGFSNSFSTKGDNDVYLIRTKQNGDTLWTKVYGIQNGNISEAGFSVQQLANGGYVVASGRYPNYDVYLLKTDANGYSGGCNEYSTSTVVSTPTTIVNSITLQNLSSSIIISPIAPTLSARSVNSSFLCTAFVCPNPPVAEAGRDTIICKGTNIRIGGNPTATGGTGKYTYQWTPAIVLDSTIIANPIASPDTTTTYSVIVTDSVKCTAKDSIVITVKPKPTAITNADTTICGGSNIKLTASGGGTYLWNTGDTLTSITVKPPKDTTYSIIASNGFCTDTAITKITVNTVKAAITGKAKLCFGTDSITTLTASGGTKYIWNTNDTTAAITVKSIGNTFYFVIASNNNCMDTAKVEVTVNSLPVIKAGNDTNIYKGDELILTASGANTYLWKPTAGLNNSIIANPLAKPTETITYVVIGTDSNSCSSTDSVTITVIAKQEQQDSCGEFFIPNAFSPNGNSVNDILKVRGKCVKEVKKVFFSIYDRWGEKVFETDDITKGWDGTYNGKALNTGVFVYYLKATLTDGNNIKKQGNVSLIR